jgi:hypothetical protein
MVTDLCSIGTLFALFWCAGVLVYKKKDIPREIQNAYVNSKYVVPFMLAAVLCF